MRKKKLLILLILICGTLIWAGTHDPWDGTKWDVTSPDIDQPYGNAYKELYDLRKGVALRMNKEHETLATNSAGGVHKQGSARAFFQDAAPTTQIDGTAWDSGDTGSLWFDSNAAIDNQFYVLTNHASTGTWTPVSTEIIAFLLASNRTFAGTLTVTGLLTANNGVTLGAGDDLIGSSTSDITFNTNKFTVAGDTGNTLVAGTLDVTGATEVTGVATLGDASLLKTSAAPSTDAMIANKKYVDDIVQIVNTTDGAVNTGTTAMPQDDSKPQITEGDEYMTVAITPVATTNKLKIDVVVFLSHSVGSHYLTAALFQDATADALAAGWTRLDSAQGSDNIQFTHFMDAGTTSETTFRVRAGGTTGATMTFNGKNGARFYGGILASSITITEIRV